MAQLVEHNLAKVGVAGSSPVVRSIALRKPVARSAFFLSLQALPYRRNNKTLGKHAPLAPAAPRIHDLVTAANRQPHPQVLSCGSTNQLDKPHAGTGNVATPRHVYAID